MPNGGPKYMEIQSTYKHKLGLTNVNIFRENSQNWYNKSKLTLIGNDVAL